MNYYDQMNTRQTSLVTWMLYGGMTIGLGILLAHLI